MSFDPFPPAPDPNALRAEGGPFDLIGDVHGCFDELVQLLPEHLRERSYRGFVVGPPRGNVLVVGLIYDDGLVHRGNPPNVGLEFDRATGRLLSIHEDGLGLGFK